jgi:outer membrane protein
LLLIAGTCAFGPGSAVYAQGGGQSAGANGNGQAEPVRSLEDVIRRTLSQNPDIRQQDWRVLGQRGALRAEAGTFDTRLTTSASNVRTNRFVASQTGGADSPITKSTSNITSYRLGVSKRLGMGLFIEPFLQVERTEALGSPLPTMNRTSLGTSLVYPLLRGRGADVARAERRSAREEVRASLQQRRFTMSTATYRTIEVFWQYIAALQTLEIAKDTEDRARRLLTETRALIEKDEKPAADLQQPKANLASREAARITAERSLASAKEQLRIVVGLPAYVPVDIALLPFPAVPDALDDRLASADAFVDAALARRDDLHATEYRQTASELRLDAAMNGRLPSLDLSVNVNYVGSGISGSVSEYVSPFGQPSSGVNATVSLRSDLAFRNRTAAGREIQQEAVYQNQRIAAQDLRRTIEINVRTTVELLRGTVRQLQRAQQAVDLYRTVVGNEQRKYKLGMSTLFDVLLAEDRLTQALQTQVQNQVRYAQLLIRLRFQTNTVLTFEQERATVSVSRLLTVPSPQELTSFPAEP